MPTDRAGDGVTEEFEIVPLERGAARLDLSEIGGRGVYWYRPDQTLTNYHPAPAPGRGLGSANGTGRMALVVASSQRRPSEAQVTSPLTTT